MSLDKAAPELREIHPDVCRSLLAAMTVGRFAAMGPNGAPHVVPVNFVSDGRFIAFRTGDGTKLRTPRECLVTFQVDHIDVHRRSGWSVMVHGFMRDEAAVHHDTRQVAALEALIPDPWVIAGGEVLVIAISDVSGREIVIHEDPRDPRGYL